jgi:hypothetical protein
MRKVTLSLAIAVLFAGSAPTGLPRVRRILR